MVRKSADAECGEQNTIEHLEAALKRMLATLHKPRSESKIWKRSNKKRASPKRRKSVEKR
jgi:hypothetical protein